MPSFKVLWLQRRPMEIFQPFFSFLLSIICKNPAFQNCAPQMPGDAHQGSPCCDCGAAKTWGLWGARHDANPLQMETANPRQHLGRKGAAMFTVGSCKAVEQLKKDRRETTVRAKNWQTRVINRREVLLSTRHPQTGFQGSLSKDFARLITLLSIIFHLGMKEAFLSLSLSVNLAFITSQCLSIWSFTASVFIRASIVAAAVSH